MVIEKETITIIIWVTGLMVAQFTAIRSSIAKLTDAITTLKVNSKDFVSHAVCSQNRKECPCVKNFGDLRERLTVLETKVGK